MLNESQSTARAEEGRRAWIFNGNKTTPSTHYRMYSNNTQQLVLLNGKFKEINIFIGIHFLNKYFN